MRHFLKTLLVASCLAAAAAAQEVPDLVTDRPDQTESIEVMPPGWVQLELGAISTHGDGDDVVEAPGTLVRIGLVRERLELRVGWTGLVSADDLDGAGDAELGVKWKLRPERGRGAGVAVVLATSVPVGDAELTSDELDPSLRFAFSHTLSDRLSLGYNVGVGWESGSRPDGATTTLSTYFYTVALGVGLGERLGVYFELFGDVPGSAPGTPATSVNGGFTFLLWEHLQVDVEAGVGLSEAAADWFVGTGLAWRLPR